ncbi:hypothetical protein CSB20_11900 [bacterium DOLZORAL124_64_63]|nr:MAG: hypothetical protein CSB20_11900 [bacterium DOLZORAL124_64_63]
MTLVALTSATFTQAQTTRELMDKVDVLTEEVAELRQQLNLPATEEERQASVYGMSPVAAKVYGANRGLSIGGYGEFYYKNKLDEGQHNSGDFYRFITYVGYKFNDRVIMNTEIEHEHATTSGNYAGKGGSVSVEFSYLDFLIQESFNLRMGNLLMPMGFLNTLHEPVFYHGNLRPSLEKYIIPTTWRELGIGAHGSFAENFTYAAYIVNGLDGNDFGSSGVRGGRQKGNRVAFDDLGLLAALDWEHEGVFWLGGSFYKGGADHNGMTNSDLAEITVSNWIGEMHAQYRNKGFQGRAMFATAGIDGAEELGTALDKLIPKTQRGFYVEAAYNIAPMIFENPSFTLTPFVRVEDLALQNSIPNIPDGSGGYYAASPSKDMTIWVIGLETKPHDQVVVKLDYVKTSTEADQDPSDEIRFGGGFAF